MSTEIVIYSPGFYCFPPTDPSYNYLPLSGNAFPPTLPYAANSDLFGFDPPLSPTADTKPHLLKNNYGAPNGCKAPTISEHDYVLGEKRKSKSLLERNRQAAIRCRRKKAYTEQLQECFQDTKSRKEILETKVSQMQSEILFLKDLMLRHSQCDDDNIRSYLSNMLTQLTGESVPTLQDVSREEDLVLSRNQICARQERLSVDSSASSEISTSMLGAVEQAHWESTVSTSDNDRPELAEDSFWHFIDFS